MGEYIKYSCFVLEEAKWILEMLFLHFVLAESSFLIGFLFDFVVIVLRCIVSSFQKYLWYFALHIFCYELIISLSN